MLQFLAVHLSHIGASLLARQGPELRDNIYLVDATLFISSLSATQQVVVDKYITRFLRQPLARMEKWKRPGKGEYLRLSFAIEENNLHMLLGTIAEAGKEFGECDGFCVQYAIRDARFNVMDALPPPRL